MKNKHDFNAAFDVCEKWLKHIDQQREKTITLQKAAAIARKGDREGARRLKNQVDIQPRIFDGANFLDVIPQIKIALKIADKLQSGEVSEEMITSGMTTGYEGCKARDYLSLQFKAMSEQLLKEVENG